MGAPHRPAVHETQSTAYTRCGAQIVPRSPSADDDRGAVKCCYPANVHERRRAFLACQWPQRTRAVSSVIPVDEFTQAVHSASRCSIQSKLSREADYGDISVEACQRDAASLAVMCLWQNRRSQSGRSPTGRIDSGAFSSPSNPSECRSQTDRVCSVTCAARGTCPRGTRSTLTSHPPGSRQSITAQTLGSATQRGYPDWQARWA